VATDASQPAQELGSFGGMNGLIMPSLYRGLECCTRCTVAKGFKLSSTWTDVYILVVFVLDVVAAGLTEWIPKGNCFLDIVLFFVIWRILFELGSITLFEFCFGSYRHVNTPLQRVVILKLINLLEMIVLFGICYYLPGRYDCSWMDKSFGSVFDAIYFSTVTGLTLGYGDYVPTHWVLKAVVIIEILFFVVIALSLLAIIRSLAPLVRRETTVRQ
jgi:hypothetical protein